VLSDNLGADFHSDWLIVHRGKKGNIRNCIAENFAVETSTYCKLDNIHCWVPKLIQLPILRVSMKGEENLMPIIVFIKFFQVLPGTHAICMTELVKQTLLHHMAKSI
jgi:hypothetical protein